MACAPRATKNWRFNPFTAASFPSLEVLRSSANLGFSGLGEQEDMPAGFRSHHQPLPRNEPVRMSYCSSTGVEYSPLCTLSPAGSSSLLCSPLPHPIGRSR